MRFTLYEQCCNWLLSSFGSPDGKLSPWQTLTSGAVAGATSVVINHPIDVVKSNMQGLRGREFRSSWHCGQVIYRSEGVRGLYKVSSDSLQHPLRCRMMSRLPSEKKL